MLDQESSNAFRLRSRLRTAAIVTGVVVVVVVGFGVFDRSRSETSLARWTQEAAIPSVTVVTPELGVGGQELVLPGEVEAFYQAPIHARVSGYLKMWYQDIGAHIKAGQLLAEIETPEVDQQLLQAKADLASARANAKLAQLTADRWKSSLVAKAVSQQTIDDKTGEAEAREAQATAAEANVRRLSVMENFKRLVAPFDGIVTARKTDIGALISATGDSGPELFTVADLHKMRIYVRVPQALSGALRPGMETTLKLPQYDQTFTAKLETTSNAVDRESRTILAEFLADNPDGKLIPGTYAEARLQLPSSPTILHIPTSALVFRQDGLRVAALDAGDKVALLPVVLGRDLGTEVEVLSGIKDTDRIIDSPPDSIAKGDVVQVTARPATPRS
jgi:multidrug efflux system membrane fusion protein